MRRIPTKKRNKLSEQEWMSKCCYCGRRNEIEWEHPLYYQGKQINEEYSIVPLCREHHRGYTLGDISREVKDHCELIAIMMGLVDLQRNYPKFDWKKRKEYLQSKVLKKYI